MDRGSDEHLGKVQGRRAGVITVADVLERSLTLFCGLCKRRGRFAVSRLMGEARRRLADAPARPPVGQLPEAGAIFGRRSMRGDVRIPERAAGAEGRAVSSELRAVNDAATAFTRRTALSIATMAPDTRIVAFHIAQHELDKAIREILGESPLGRDWLMAQMADIRALVAKIDASGGAAGGRA
jgi:hypothetical protein